MISHSRAAVAGLILYGAGLVAISAPAEAASDRVRRACMGDYRRMCGQYKVNTPPMRACMEANAFSLSSPCITALIDSGEVDGSKVRKRR